MQIANHKFIAVKLWGGLGAFRMNDMVNQAKAPASQGFNSTMENHKTETSMVAKSTVGSYQTRGNAKLGKPLFAKVEFQ
ncbi:hypothetical protein V6N13_146949 [Hibiscus sabdariffa]|uniref:Uncharacterized protein n=1 Tax=Hibiscus sabdariffa TaxID=183260 RepID=A0ABR2TU96_9ROSI